MGLVHWTYQTIVCFMDFGGKDDVMWRIVFSQQKSFLAEVVLLLCDSQGSGGVWLFARHGSILLCLTESNIASHMFISSTFFFFEWFSRHFVPVCMWGGVSICDLVLCKTVQSLIGTILSYTFGFQWLWKHLPHGKQWLRGKDWLGSVCGRLLALAGWKWCTQNLLTFALVARR